MKKTIAIILTAILALSLGLTVSAEGGDAVPSGDAIKQTMETEIESNPTDGNMDDMGNPEDTDDTALGINPFAALLDAVRDYLPEILGALTFIGSLILAFLYKRGLIPIVKASLSTLTGIVSEVKDRTESGELLLGEKTDAMKARLSVTEQALATLTESFDRLRGELAEAEERSLDRAALTSLMTTQVELLYDIFMSSSIPQFQKELVGESVAKMKEALLGNEKTES